jgi:hypothetical protein
MLRHHHFDGTAQQNLCHDNNQPHRASAADTDISYMTLPCGGIVLLVSSPPSFLVALDQLNT